MSDFRIGLRRGSRRGASATGHRAGLPVPAVGYSLVRHGHGALHGRRRDWTLAPATHINLLGWVTTALYALVYRAAPAMAETAPRAGTLAFRRAPCC